jgi:hypothetical protein
MFLDKKNHGTFVDESATLDDAMLECAVDVERAWGQMMIECCALEFKAYQESGDVSAVNEGVVETIKGWFKKAWEAIKKFFGKFLAVIRSKTMSLKEFYDKYEKDIEAGKSKVKEFKGFDYSLEAVTLEKDLPTFDETKEKDEEVKKDAIAKTMGQLIKGSTVDSEDEAVKAIRKALQGGDTDKKTLTNFDAMVNNAKKADSDAKKAAYDLKVMEMAIKESEAAVVKEVEAADKADNEDNKKKAHRKLSAAKTCIGLKIKACSLKAKATDAFNSQTMSFLRAAVSASKKKDEGADYGMSTNEAMDYLRSQGIEF